MKQQNIPLVVELKPNEEYLTAGFELQWVCENESELQIN